MFSFNRVHIIGYQTQPVSVRQTPGGTSVTDLNLVVPTRFRTDAGETLESKGFHAVTLWGPMAEVAGRFVKPGSQLFISGRLQTDSWEDEKTGEKRSKTKIIALDMILLDPKGGLLPQPGGTPPLSAALNRADVIGNVTRDPEMRTTTGGQQVLTIGVATNERWKDRTTREEKERVEFHSVVVWGELAKSVATTVKKGNRVMVTGRVQTRSWETKDGAKRYTTEITAESVALLGTRNASVEGNIQPDGAAVGTEEHAQADPGLGVAQPGGAVEVPELQYASEVRVEDLPF